MNLFMAKYKPYLIKSEILLIEKLKKIRIEKNLSQAKLAEKVGASRASIAELENFYKKPKKKTIAKIAAGLDYPIDDLEQAIKIIKFDRMIFEERITPVPISKNIIRNNKELNQLSLESNIFIPYRLIDYVYNILQENIYAYIMPDDSMFPTIKKNDIALIKFFEQGFPKLNDSVSGVILACFNEKKSVGVIREYRTYDNAVFFNPVNHEFNSILIKNIKHNSWKIKGIIVAVISERLLIDMFDKNILKTFDLL